MATDNAGSIVGSVEEEMWFFVPSFSIKDPMGTATHTLHMPTCFGGMCVDCCAEGCCNCRIPFYVYKVSPKHPHARLIFFVCLFISVCFCFLFYSIANIIFHLKADNDTPGAQVGSITKVS